MILRVDKRGYLLPKAGGLQRCGYIKNIFKSYIFFLKKEYLYKLLEDFLINW